MNKERLQQFIELSTKYLDRVSYEGLTEAQEVNLVLQVFARIQNGTIVLESKEDIPPPRPAVVNED